MGEANAARAAPLHRIPPSSHPGPAAFDPDGMHGEAGTSSPFEARQREAIREIVCDMLIAAVSTQKRPGVGDAHG